MTDSVVHILHDVVCSSQFPLINLLENNLHLVFAKKETQQVFFSKTLFVYDESSQSMPDNFIANTYFPQIGKCH
jgi:hypothetical protein